MSSGAIPSSFRISSRDRGGLRNGSTSNPLLPAQALTVGDCLRAYTAESAWINRRDTGRLRIGAPADLVVADRNPFAIDPAELSSVSTDLTVARGRVVYERTRS